MIVFDFQHLFSILLFSFTTGATSHLPYYLKRLSNVFYYNIGLSYNVSLKNKEQETEIWPWNNQSMFF